MFLMKKKPAGPASLVAMREELLILEKLLSLKNSNFTGNFSQFRRHYLFKPQ